MLALNIVKYSVIRSNEINKYLERRVRWPTHAHRAARGMEVGDTTRAWVPYSNKPRGLQRNKRKEDKTLYSSIHTTS